MEERRILKRQYIMFYSRVFNRRTGEVIGYLGDLTAQGMMVIAERPIDTIENHRISMDLPEELYDKPSLHFVAKSVWCRPDINPEFYTIGFQLIDPAPEDVDIIHRVIEDYGLLEF